TPGPIPNPEAKPFSADGTAGGTLWESRTPPDTHIPEWPPHRWPFGVNTQTNSAAPKAIRRAMSDERESRDKRPRPRYAAADDGNRRSSDRPSSRDRSGTGPERGSDRSDSPRADRERSSRAPGGKRYGDKP